MDRTHSTDEGQVSTTNGSTKEQTYTRLSVNLNDEAAAVLRDIAKKRGVSITEAVRRAIAIYGFIESELAEGGKVQVVDKSGHVRELFLF